MLKKIFLPIFAILIICVGYFYFKDFTTSIPDNFYIYLDKALIVILSLIFTYIATIIVDIFFTKGVFKIIKHDSLGKKILPLIHNIINIVIWILGVFVTISLLGFNINTLIAGAGVGGVFLAIIGKEAISNLFGSLSLVFSKSFKIGDYIRIKSLEGTVDEINLTYTRIIDAKGNYIFIPNKNIISESIENISVGKYKRQEIIIPFSINLELSKIEKVLSEIEKELEKLKKSEKITEFKVIFDNYNYNSQNYIIRFHGKISIDALEIKKELSLKIRKILDSQKIVFESI